MNKLHNMLSAIGEAINRMHNSEDLNDAIAELQVGIDDEATANKATDIVDTLFDTVKEAFESAAKQVAELSKTTVETEGELTPETVDEIAELATAFYESGDELLMKQASVLDEILLTLAAPKNAVSEYKRAEEEQVNKLRQKSREEHLKQDYHDVDQELKEYNKAEETGKAVADQVKTYITMEQPLSTRYCPDHSGQSTSRIGDNTYQCPLDHKIYNYDTGFTTMKGNKVPGGNVANQTLYFGTREDPHVIFDSRESRLNNG